MVPSCDHHRLYHGVLQLEPIGEWGRMTEDVKKGKREEEEGGLRGQG